MPTDVGGVPDHVGTAALGCPRGRSPRHISPCLYWTWLATFHFPARAIDSATGGLTPYVAAKLF
jgi:hypothetical protein